MNRVIKNHIEPNTYIIDEYHIPEYLDGFEYKSIDLPFDEITLIWFFNEYTKVIKCSQFSVNEVAVSHIATYRNNVMIDNSVYKVLIEDGEKPGKLSVRNHVDSFKVTDDMTKLYVNIAMRFISFIQSKESVQATVKKSFKTRKKKYKECDLTYLSSKRYCSEIKGVRDIDWKCCFSVCGHWRKINGIGKDRSGSRCIKGYTWVLPHEKNKHLEKIDKLRIVR